MNRFLLSRTSFFMILFCIIAGLLLCGHSVCTAGETGRDGRFIAFDDGTVLDTKTNLMWAARDNGSDINWGNAKSYCENYRGGGYTDWRMPTMDELEGLYDENKPRPATCKIQWVLDNPIYVTTELIDITCYAPWASETRGSEVALFNFIGKYKPGFGFRDFGKRQWYPPSTDLSTRALPVRSGNIIKKYTDKTSDRINILDPTW